MSAKKDPRLIRTQQIIHEAFYVLLQDNDYEDITVQNIIEKAQINRTTFYKHYLNKELLAIEVAEQFKKQILLPLLSERFSLPISEFSTKTVPYVQQYRSKLKLLFKIKTRHYNFKHDVLKLIKNAFIQASIKQHLSQEMQEQDLEMQGTIFANLTLAIMEYYIINDHPLDPQVLIKNLKIGLEVFLKDK